MTAEDLEKFMKTEQVEHFRFRIKGFCLKKSIITQSHFLRKWPQVLRSVKR